MSVGRESKRHGGNRRMLGRLGLVWLGLLVLVVASLRPKRAAAAAHAPVARAGEPQERVAPTPSRRVRGRGAGRVVASTAVALVLFVGGVTTAFATLARDTLFQSSSAVPTGNLLKNPGAEEGAGSTVLPEGSVVDIPGWDREPTSKFTVIQYGTGDFPSTAASAEIGGGANFFGGGPSNALSSASQTIDLAEAASEIDTGAVKAKLSAHMGGFSSQGDKGPVDAVFLNAAGAELGKLTLAPVFPSERGSATKLILREASGDVPKDTRSVRVVMTAERQTGSSNDTYFDNLSLTLEGPPPSDTTTTTDSVVDLHLTKSDSPDPVHVGDQLTYTIEVANEGTAEATGAKVTDTLPAGVAFVSASEGCGSTRVGEVVCDLGNIAPGASATVTIVVEVGPEANTPLTNTAFVSSNEEPDGANNSDTEETVIVPAEAEPVSLSLNVVDAPAPVTVGGELSYFISVVNEGRIDATGVTVENELPATVDFVPASSSENCELGEGGVACFIGALPIDTSVDLTVVVRPKEPGEIVNRVTLRSAEVDANPDDNTATVVTTVQSDEEPPPAECAPLARSLDDGGIVVGESWVECSAPGANNIIAAGTPLLPPSNGSQALLTSGSAAAALDTSQGASVAHGTTARGANDVSILRLDVLVPESANCLSFDFVFGSEEYPEFVGSAFNDGFLAELDTSDWSVDGSTISAAHNFAFGPDGRVVSVNSTFFTSVVTENGTAYDGATPRLRAQTPVTPGMHSLYLSIFDASDWILDSGVFVDYLTAGTVGEGECRAGADEPNGAPDAVDDALTTDEDTAGGVDVLANDSDPDKDALSVTGSTNGAHGTVVCDGDCTYTPAANYHGPDSFTYTISDGRGGSDTATVNVTVSSVNDPPTAVDDELTTDEDTSATLNVLANDTDPDGDTLTMGEWSDPAHGTVTCTETGSCTYTPDANYSGPDGFSYGVSDGNGGSDVGTVNITVNAVNRAPDAVDDTLETNEDSPKSVNVLGNDTDPDGDALTITGSTNGAHGTVSCDDDCTYTPAANFNGPDAFTYTISDGNGETDTATVNVTVAPVNDPPNAVDDEATTAEDTPREIDVLANDSDLESEVLEVTGKTDGAHGTVVCPETSCTYTPDDNFHGLDSFTYTIREGDGGSDTATVHVTVTPVNDEPDAVDDDLTTDEDTPGSVPVLANDTDVDGDNLSLADSTNGEFGTVSCAERACTYTPNPGFVGEDSFEYTISDGNEGSDTATVHVTVNPVNHPPDAVDDVLETDEDSPKSVNVLGNDTDSDGDVLSITGSTNGAHGTVSCDEGCTYTPAPNFHGTDEFTYTISDGNEGSEDTATVHVTVTPVNDAPNAVDDAMETDEDSPQSVSVLGNDTDPDGDALIITGSTNGAHGTVSCDEDCTYTPAANFHGDDSFTYTISDGHEGGEDTATVDVIVNPVNDAPNAVDDALTTNANTAAVVSVLTNDTDPDGDSLNASGSTNGAHGTVTCTALGACTYTPDTNYSGPDSFTYTASDGNGGSDTGTVNVTVNPLATPQPPPPPPPPPAATLTFNVSVSPDNPAIGDTVSYTIRVDNPGRVAAHGVTLLHEAPGNATFVSADASQGSCAGTLTLVCSLGTIDPAAAASRAGGHHASSVTVVHRVRFTSAGDATSTVTLEGANSASSRQSTSVSVLASSPVTPQQQPEPPTDDGVPNPNQTVVVEVISGVVLVRLPGTDQFVPLTALTELPNGTEVDASQGRIRLTSAAPGDTTQSSEFFDGVFTVAQTAGSSFYSGSQAAVPGVTELRLTRGDFSKCTAQPAKAKAKKAKKKRKPAVMEQAKPRQPVRRLWGEGKGRFRTRGRYSSATVRGTVWLTEDYCNGTLIRVQEGSVTVRDLVKKRTVVVAAGKSYFAEAPQRKAAKAKPKKKR